MNSTDNPPTPTKLIQNFKRDNVDQYQEISLKIYGNIIKRFFEYTKKSIIEIETCDIIQWIRDLKDNRVSPSTLNQYVISLKSFFNYCKEEELITQNPIENIGKLKVPNRLPNYFGHETYFKLCEVSKNSLRDRAIIETLFTTGIRVSELVNILIQDIDFDKQEIFIRNGKGGHTRYVLLSGNCGFIVKRYLKSRKDSNPYLFISDRNKGISRKRVSTLISKYVQKANIKQHITPHTFRHSFAMLLSNKNIPFEIISLLLGHIDLKNIKTYARLSEASKETMFKDKTL